MLRYKHIVSPVRFLKHEAEVSLLLNHDPRSLCNIFSTFRWNHFVLEDELTANFQNVKNFNPEKGKPQTIISFRQNRVFLFHKPNILARLLVDESLITFYKLFHP